MDFIMHVWKKHDAMAFIPDRTQLTSLILMLLVSLMSVAGTSPAITIETATGTIYEGIYSINAAISYQLGSEASKALDHGVPLEFDTELQLLKYRPWIWDKLISASTITYRVEHQPLSGQYLVTRLNTGSRHQFQDLAGVLEFMGKIQKFPLVETSQLAGNEGYYVRMRTRLNIEALPAPLRPLAYLSSQWRLASPWQTWKVKE